MDFTPGYRFFEPENESTACGYVLIRFVKNMLKIQCVAENIPAAAGRSVLLCLADSFQAERPRSLGRIYLNGQGNRLRGEQNFTVNGRSLFSLKDKYDCFELISEQSRARLLRTRPVPNPARQKTQESKVPEPEENFDPFHTTNPAYSWYRAEKADRLREELTSAGIYLPASLSDELKTAMDRYRHILLGKYQPKGSEKAYFLLGLPGMQPADDPDKIYRWINKCADLAEYPPFDGYKLFYYDSETGAAVKAVLKR